MNLEHHYAVESNGRATGGPARAAIATYGRDLVLSAAGKHDIAGSSDRVFHGDADRWNPEDMLLGALSQCHLLSYLHVASSRGVVVTAYTGQRRRHDGADDGWWR